MSPVSILTESPEAPETVVADRRLRATRYEIRGADGTRYVIECHEGTEEWSVYRFGTGEILSAELTWDRSTGDRESQASWRESHRFTLRGALDHLRDADASTRP